MDLKFQKNGLRVLDSRGGDLLIADPKFNVQILFTAEFLKLAKSDPQKMAVLGKKLTDFIDRHTERRWKKVLEDLRRLSKIPENNSFVFRMMKFTKEENIDNLRKLEKEIFYHETKELL